MSQSPQPPMPSGAVDVTRPSISPLLTIGDAINLMGGDISARQVQRLARAGKLPGAVYIGSKLRFRATEFKAFVEGRDNVFSAMRKGT